MAGVPTVVSEIGAALRTLSNRQRVIADNIANADTPGFKAKTLAEPEFSTLVRSRGRIARPMVSVTSGMAALGAKGTHAGPRTVVDRSVTETKPNGNNVTLEDQLLELGEIQANYATMTSLYRKQMQLMKSALGRPGQ